MRATLNHDKPAPIGRRQCASHPHCSRQISAGAFRALRFLRSCFLILPLIAGTSVEGQTNTNTAGRLEYSNFRIIAERNIFNPRRRAGEHLRAGPTRTSRVDSFALVGIMSYGKGPFAFFDGTRSEYRKVLKLGDSIAGYTITNIAPNSAKLISSTNQVELHVGMQLRRADNGGWQVAAASETPVAPTAPARPGGRAGPAAPPAGAAAPAAGNPEGDTPLETGIPDQVAVLGASGEATNAEPATAASDSMEADPALRRLMERRNQELNR